MISEDEKRVQCVKSMGGELGVLYCDLNDQLVEVLILWEQFEQLFGVNEETVQVLNSSAPSFFGIVQVQFLDAVMLGVSRLTDSPENKSQKNLSIRAIPPLVSDLNVRRQVNDALKDALDATKFARDHRNKRIAHSDLLHVQRGSAKPLPPASRTKIKAALDSICAVLETLNGHYRQSEFAYDTLIYGGGAERVVALLRDGLKHQDSELEY
ncbi:MULTISPECIES: AbiU2 domain-containing protein [unclassified Pseudomonas]|uniref:AbiU2 domain-containing protein n=1 Tax=unclassified Pseudomonas TaxID=196821 RepID=UPI002113F6B4|nr:MULTISPECIES: hypothetical protein [unclassified Pseudomonas]